MCKAITITQDKITMYDGFELPRISNQLSVISFYHMSDASIKIEKWKNDWTASVNKHHITSHHSSHLTVDVLCANIVAIYNRNVSRRKSSHLRDSKTLTITIEKLARTSWCRRAAVPHVCVRVCVCMFVQCRLCSRDWNNFLWFFFCVCVGSVWQLLVAHTSMRRRHGFWCSRCRQSLSPCTTSHSERSFIIMIVVCVWFYLQIEWSWTVNTISSVDRGICGSIFMKMMI